MPLLELEKISDGDGGFVVLAVTCFLYERYVKALFKSLNKTENYKLRMEQISKDFQTDEHTAKIFWNVIRNRLLHRGTPKQVDKGKPLPTWVIYDDPNPFKLSPDSKMLYVNIWKIRDIVLDLYEKKPELLGIDNDYPWGQIWRDEYYIIDP